MVLLNKLETILLDGIVEEYTGLVESTRLALAGNKASRYTYKLLGYSLNDLTFDKYTKEVKPELELELDYLILLKSLMDKGGNLENTCYTGEMLIVLKRLNNYYSDLLQELDRRYYSFTVIRTVKDKVNLIKKLELALLTKGVI